MGGGIVKYWHFRRRNEACVPKKQGIAGEHVFAMKKMKVFFESFRVRVALALILVMLLTGLASGLLIQQFAIQAQFERLRNKLKTVASVIAVMVDAEKLQKIPLNQNGVQFSEYLAIYQQLEQIKQENPSIGFIYVMKKTSEEGILKFVVDPDPYLSKKGIVTAYPGDLYDARRFPNMLKAFEQPVAETEIQSDVWGSMLSGYAPIRDRKDKTIGIVGVDMMASDVYKLQKEIHQRILVLFWFGIVLSLWLATWFSKRLTRSMAALAEGIHRVSHGNLDYKIPIRGHDEIAELSRSFNQMAADLHEMRQKKRDYFYGVIRSLILIVEARDSYTRGHSERVAAWTVRIAKRLGISSEKVEMLEQSALLHDIGKLGVHEKILGKKEPLTPEEWEILCSHPVIGEEILRPVLLDPEMLSIVRGHHERYDGRGYPDRLAGEEIHFFTQILSVADAYDAMTSTRPYRGALSLEQAIEEIRQNRGLQFSPKIVDVFLEILREGSQTAGPVK